MKEIKLLMKDESGQGMTEYIIIVALIAIAAIGVITFYGENIRDLFGSSSSALSGNTGVVRKINPVNTTLTTKNLSDTGKNNTGKGNGSYGF